MSSKDFLRLSERLLILAHCESESSSDWMELELEDGMMRYVSSANFKILFKCGCIYDEN